MDRDAITTLRTWLWSLLPQWEQEGMRIHGTLLAAEEHATITITWSRLGSGEHRVRIASDGSFRINAPARGILRIRIISTQRLGRTVEVDARGLSDLGRRILARKAIELDIDPTMAPERPFHLPFHALLYPMEDTGILIRIWDDPRPAPDPASDHHALLNTFV